MRSISRQLPRIALACVFATSLSSLAPSSRAQAIADPMQDSASHIADAFSHAKLSRIVVFDFSGPDKKMNQLGEDFEAAFRAMLAKSSPKLQLEDAQQVDRQLEKLNYAPEIALYPDALLAAAQDLHVSGFVMGQMSVDGDKLTIAISAYRVRDGKGLRSMQVSWALTAEMKALVDKKIGYETSENGGAPFVDAKEKGWTMPRCLYCPRADYSTAGMEQRAEGVTELLVIVETDGTVSHIRVVRPLAYGLTAMAIEAVRTWKLAPALDSDGKPARVRQLIEVTFQLFGGPPQR